MRIASAGVIGILAAFSKALVALVAGVALQLVAAQLPSTKGRAGVGVRLAALGLVAVSLAFPFALGGPPIFRGLLAQALVAASWRVIEILRKPGRYARRERALRVVLIPFEYTFLERAPRRWPFRELFLSSVLLAIGIIALVFASRLGPPSAPYARAGWPRWLAAAAASYVVMEGMTWQWVAILPAFGWRHRPYQRHPILSRTLAEFWGVRWSSVIHRWLRSNVYEPLAARRLPRLGVMAAFFASALLHAYMMWPAAGRAPALWMLAFFVAQGAGLVIEAKLRVRRWPSAAGRAYVIAIFAATIPLFMEPTLRAVGL